MLDLPSRVPPLRVALAFNQKKEDVVQKPIPSNIADPSAAGSDTAEMTSADSPPVSLRTSDDRFAEWDEPETIEAVGAALAEVHSVTLIEADAYFYDHVREMRPDIVFNIAEGLNGISREAQVPALLDMLGIPYTGSDPLTLAICLDKSRTKEILTYHGIRNARFHVIWNTDEVPAISPVLPVMVKPLHEGSSKGIFDSSLARTPEELSAAVEKVVSGYNQPALVEEYLPGREFTVAILGNGADVRVLPIVEIRFESLPQGVNPIYSYEAKWLWDTIDNPLDIYECPARISPELEREIGEICSAAYRILRCRDWSRIDVRLDADNRPHIIEVNPLPGILPNPDDNSCLPKAARAAGIEYNTLIQSALGFAAIRHGLIRPHVPVPETI